MKEALIFSVIIFIFSGFSCREEIVSPVEDVSKTGYLNISTDPIRAKIWLDGNLVSKVTPDTINHVSAGPHFIKLTKSGYRDTTVIVEVTPGGIQRIEVSLQRGNI